ncbi:MAG: class I SAM-dependent methyltransferase [Halofilum sp. (in: g-proteobacteria)]
MSGLYPSQTVVVCASTKRRAEAEALARALDLACVAELPAPPDWIALVLDDERLSLQLTGPGAPGPVSAEFVSGRGGWRAREAKARGETLSRAAGVGRAGATEVIDATAGLGRDGFLLAAGGCRVTLVERHPAVVAVLRDGLARAAAASATAESAARVTLVEADAREFLSRGSADVVLVDPMHPPRRKSAAVRKEMRLFRALVGRDDDAAELLNAALSAARRRVVVKRPAGAPSLAGRPPSGAIEERSTRFDIYAGLADR